MTKIYITIFRSQEERSRSRSRSLTPEIDREPLQKPEEKLALEHLSNNQQPEEETEQMRIQKEQEAAEQERLRQEVAKLENQIEPDVVRRAVIRKPEDSDCSNTDVSDNEEKDVPPTESKTEDMDDNLKQEILKRILEKQQEEKKKESEVEAKTSDQAKTQEDIEMKTEPSNEEEQKEEKEIDMFADSGDEAGTREDNELGETIQENEEKKKISTDVAEPMQEDPIENTDSVETEPTVVTDAIVQGEQVPEKPEIDTLKSLHDLRDKMDQMTSEELELALKGLPSGTNLTKDVDDGRTTPVHLRDIHVPIQSLTEFVYDKKILFKQLFRSVNKKEFKRMLPKYLRVSFNCY